MNINFHHHHHHHFELSGGNQGQSFGGLSNGLSDTAATGPGRRGNENSGAQMITMNMINGGNFVQIN